MYFMLPTLYHLMPSLICKYTEQISNCWFSVTGCSLSLMLLDWMVVTNYFLRGKLFSPILFWKSYNIFWYLNEKWTAKHLKSISEWK